MIRPRALGWLAVAALLWPWGGQEPRGANGSPAQRLAGPIASLAASVQWVRYDLALRDGRYERAYALAQAALALDPLSPGGWLTLGRHLVTFRASPQNEPDPARRAEWVRAGLDVLEEGERVARPPGELALARGLFLAGYVGEILAETPRELDWPGGRRAALEEAEAAFERARELGHPRATEGLDAVREALGH